MALTERWIVQGGAGAGDGTSQANGWTLVDGFTNAAAGHLVNVQSNSAYTYAGGVVTNTGTAVDPIWFRGYNTTPGDLDDQGRTNGDEELDITNFPVININTAAFTIGTSGRNTVFQNIVFTGALSSLIIGSNATDTTYFINCKILNTQNNASARAIILDDNCVIINCDFECSGAAHNSVVECDTGNLFDSCRVKSVAANGIVMDKGAVRNSVILKTGSAANIGIQFKQGLNNNLYGVNACTINNFAEGVQFPNAAPTYIQRTLNNHITNCTTALDSAYSGTDEIFLVELHSRLRDNTSDRSGIAGQTFGIVTTDTGGDETDFVDASSDDFSLISTAPGKAAGLVGFTDIGALQREEAASGGGLLTHPGMAGGMRG